MDIISQYNSLKCTNHSNSEILFIKINDINNSNQILYCEICIEKLDSFKPSNFLRVKKILSPDNLFIHQWPPLDNSNLTQKIIQITSNMEQSYNLEQKLKHFFDELKIEIYSKIDDCQKSMIRIASQLPELNKLIIEKFEDISKFNNFKNTLQNNQLDNQEKEKQLKELIIQANSQKYQYEEQFINILNEFDQQNRKINFERANTSKTQVFSLIENITFFDQIKCENEQKQIEFNLKNNLVKQIEDILPDLQMIYSRDVKITQNDEMEIKKLSNNQIEIMSQKKCRCYSNIILDKNKKYIFRLSTKILSFQNQSFIFGLIQDQYKEKDAVLGEQFYRQHFQFSKDKQQLQVSQNNDFIKETEGDWDKMKEFMNIEIRVDQQNQIFQIFDYPNYRQKLSLKDDEKKNMKNNDYRLYLYLEGQICVTLISAFI